MRMMVPCPDRRSGHGKHWNDSEAYAACVSSSGRSMPSPRLPSGVPPRASSVPMCQAFTGPELSRDLSVRLDEPHDVSFTGQRISVSYEGVRGDRITETFSFHQNSETLAYVEKDSTGDHVRILGSGETPVRRQVGDALIRLMMVDGTAPVRSWRDDAYQN